MFRNFSTVIFTNYARSDLSFGRHGNDVSAELVRTCERPIATHCDGARQQTKAGNWYSIVEVSMDVT